MFDIVVPMLLKSAWATPVMATRTTMALSLVMAPQRRVGRSVASRRKSTKLLRELVLRDHAGHGRHAAEVLRDAATGVGGRVAARAVAVGGRGRERQRVARGPRRRGQRRAGRV